jgi:hypothetical protein
MVKPVRTIFMLGVWCVLCSVVPASAQGTGQATVPDYAASAPVGVALEGWDYPYPVHTLQFELEGQLVRMAYMDVTPSMPNGETVLLFHGKNFGSDVRRCGTRAAYGIAGSLSRRGGPVLRGPLTTRYDGIGQDIRRILCGE